MITALRKDKDYRDKIYTVNNDRLQTLMASEKGPNGVKMILKGKGENLLWLKLRDALGRASPAVNNTRTCHSNSTNQNSARSATSRSNSAPSESHGYRTTYRRGDLNFKRSARNASNYVPR